MPDPLGLFTEHMHSQITAAGLDLDEVRSFCRSGCLEHGARLPEIVHGVEVAALAFLSIPDDVERAFWGLKVYGKVYPSILDSWCTAVLQGGSG